MRVSYDQTHDVLTVVLREESATESDEPRPGVVLDYGGAGDLVAVEIRQASTRVHDPTSVHGLPIATT